MINFDKYKRPTSLEQAYDLIINNDAVVAGGMQWMIMLNSYNNMLVDLSSLNLDHICITQNNYEIGAMFTLRQLETSSELNNCFNNIFKDAVCQIVGVQFRNLATIGGSVYGAYNFSDIIPVLLVLDANLDFYKSGIVSLSDFINLQIKQKDILTHIIVPKNKNLKCAFESLRFTKTDFSVLNVAISKYKNIIKLAVGANSSRTKLITFDTNEIDFSNNEDLLNYVSNYCLENLDFGSDLRASEQYRRQICPVLIKRAWNKMEKLNEN